MIFRGQWRFSDGRRRVENGTTATVTGVDVDRGVLTVRTDEPSPRSLDVDADESAPPLKHAYAMHVNPSQGVTRDRGYVVAGGWQTHREGLYVACSRSRLGTHIFTDRESLAREVDADAVAELAARGSRSRAKVAAASYPHSPTGRRRVTRRPRRRCRVQSRRPLTEVYARRLRLRCARIRARNARVDAKVAEQIRHIQRRREPTVADIAEREGVPAWVIHAVQEVTQQTYV